MGKKAKFKKIRRLASQMPVINVKAVKAERIAGSELIKQGVKEVQGEQIDPKIDYKQKSVVQRPLNHNRNMKRMYNKYGLKGVNYYLSAVQNHINKQANPAKA